MSVAKKDLKLQRRLKKKKLKTLSQNSNFSSIKMVTNDDDHLKEEKKKLVKEEHKKKLKEEHKKEKKEKKKKLKEERKKHKEEERKKKHKEQKEKKSSSYSSSSLKVEKSSKKSKDKTQSKLDSTRTHIGTTAITTPSTCAIITANPSCTSSSSSTPLLSSIANKPQIGQYKFRTISHIPPTTSSSIITRGPVHKQPLNTTVNIPSSIRDPAVRMVTPTPISIPKPRPRQDCITSSSSNDSGYLQYLGGPRNVFKPENPLYSKLAQEQGTIRPEDFIIRGLNDTEESRLLTQTFASKWHEVSYLKKLEAKTGLKYRGGRFTKEECILAVKLTTKFCQDNNMTLDDFRHTFFDRMNEEHGRLSASFFVDVAQHFGGRPVYSIHNRLKRIFHPGNYRGSFSEEDDQILLQMYRELGPKWALIGKALNRFAINCRDRYKIRWRYAGKLNHGHWTEEEDRKLIGAIEECLNTSGSISWIWVAENRVITRSPTNCLRRWDILKGNCDKSSSLKKSSKSSSLTSETVEERSWTEEQDFLLLKALQDNKASSEDTIDWRDLQIPGIPDDQFDLPLDRWSELKEKAGLLHSSETLPLTPVIEAVRKFLNDTKKAKAKQ